MAPSCIAELLLKLLVPVQLDEMLVAAEIVPPLLYAVLPMKLVVRVKLLYVILIAPPVSSFAEWLMKLLMKSFVPLKVSTTLAAALIAPPLTLAELLLKTHYFQ